MDDTDKKCVLSLSAISLLVSCAVYNVMDARISICKRLAFRTSLFASAPYVWLAVSILCTGGLQGAAQNPVLYIVVALPLLFLYHESGAVGDTFRGEAVGVDTEVLTEEDELYGTNANTLTTSAIGATGVILTLKNNKKKKIAAATECGGVLLYRADCGVSGTATTQDRERPT